MSISSFSSIIALALLLSADVALAQTTAPDGQKPADESGQTPPAEQKPAEQPKCISEHSGFRQYDNKRAAFEVALENICEQRIRCVINASVMNSMGAVSGKGTLTLAAKSKGAAAKKTWALAVKEAGGIASMSRSCKAI